VGYVLLSLGVYAFTVLGASMRAGEGGGASVSAKEPSLNPMEHSLSVG
jgi:hypothetical protein